MNTPHMRVELRRLVDAFFVAWAGNDWQTLRQHVSGDAVLLSNQHGKAFGPTDIFAALGTDAGVAPMRIRISNRYMATQEDHASACAYALADRQGMAGHSLFGATVIFAFTRQNDVWKVAEVRLSVNWYRGEIREVSHWHNVPNDAGWTLGDPPPVIVSEVDSPWARIAHSDLTCTAEEALPGLFTRYAFALDQGDFALLADCLAIDVEGSIPPLGHLSGRHELIGKLKSFRRHWPWMQHFADVPLIEVDPGDRSARMLVARITPERQKDMVGGRIYGAHYQIHADRESDGHWRICWIDYRPGWFALDQLPPMDPRPDMPSVTRVLSAPCGPRHPQQ